MKVFENDFESVCELRFRVALVLPPGPTVNQAS